MNRRIKAFTLMEVTVAMLIAGIAISITYTIYTIVVRSYSAYTVKNNQMAVLIRLDELLKKDFEHADVVLKEQSGLAFKSADKLVNYAMEPDFIVRTGIATDTFKVKVQELSTLFENAPLTEVNAEEEQNRIDELHLDLLFEDRKIPYHYHKQYSAANLIQRNTHAID